MRGTIFVYKKKYIFKEIWMHLKQHSWCELKMEFFKPWTVSFHFWKLSFNWYDWANRYVSHTQEQFITRWEVQADHFIYYIFQAFLFSLDSYNGGGRNLDSKHLRWKQQKVSVDIHDSWHSEHVREKHVTKENTCVILILSWSGFFYMVQKNG